MKKEYFYIILISSVLMFSGCSTAFSENKFIINLEQKNEPLYDILRDANTRIIIDKTSGDYNGWKKSFYNQKNTLTSKEFEECTNDITQDIITYRKYFDNTVICFGKSAINNFQTIKYKTLSNKIIPLYREGATVVYINDKNDEGDIHTIVSYKTLPEYHREYHLGKMRYRIGLTKVIVSVIDVKSSKYSEMVYSATRKVYPDNSSIEKEYIGWWERTRKKLVKHWAASLDKYNVKYKFVLYGDQSND